MADAISYGTTNSQQDEPALLARAEANRVAIVALAGGLMALGAVMTFSANATLSRPMIGWDFWKFPAVRQLLFVAGGLTALMISAKLPYRIWFAARGMPSTVLLIVGLLLVGLVFVPGIGVEVNNARRWVRFGPVQFQPSELVKLGLPMFMAAYITMRADIRQFWRGLMPLLVVMGFTVGAVGLEDFGTGALLAAVGGAMLLVAGARLWHLVLLILPAIPAFGFLLLSRAHRMQRLTTFLDIWQDPEGKGYQVVQSLCTIASGGWWGRGLGRGFVKTYLPERQNDFIFAVINEELGFVGACAVIALFVALMWKCRQAIVRCNDPAGRLLAFAIAMMIGTQAAMNIAVVNVSVPTKGIALPFVSAGGSGIIFLGFLVGVLANIARTGPMQPAEENDG